jgi:hypothetical protein
VQKRPVQLASPRRRRPAIHHLANADAAASIVRTHRPGHVELDRLQPLAVYDRDSMDTRACRQSRELGASSGPVVACLTAPAPCSSTSIPGATFMIVCRMTRTVIVPGQFRRRDDLTRHDARVRHLRRGRRLEQRDNRRRSES